ncbi:MAG TPA: HEAT repeat domain-containing protein, partial [Kofleriaceae bacterium]|nr:HEAT repeat domain-containing protein [Kofleriaceae bacterium]
PPRLTWLLDDGDADVRAFAFDALAKLAVAGGASGELAFAELALRCSQEDIRVRALQILVRAGAPGTPAHARADALLGDALDDEAAKVRLEAFRTLWAWHTADPETPIARGAASRHADLRAQVVAEIERRRQAKQATPAMERQLVALVRDPSPQVGLAAFAALTKAPDGSALVAAPEVYVAAMESPAAQVRAAGAAGARHAPASAVRARLVKLIEDDHPPVHLAAIEALDAVAPNDAEGFALALGSIFYELRVRAGELCGDRRDVRASGPMQKLLAIGKTDFNRPSDPIRQRAARALGSIGDASAIGFLQGLVDDDDPRVRAMAARGRATAAQPGSSQALAALLALLGHGDLAVRSWGGEGLAKLGDLRALPVLAGTQRHDHRPLRIGAIVGFVALGPDGVRGLRQGLEDKDREIADLAFAVIVARDAALAEAGIAPDLLVDAMASPSAEIRFAAARLYERRARGERADDVIAELVGPRQPEKAADMKDWPPPPRRSAMLAVVGNAIASDDPGQRYAATQVLALRPQPLTFWREAARLSGPARGAPIANTTWSTEARLARKTGWLRRLVGERREPEATELEGLARLFLRSGAPAPIEAAAAQRLVFGVYAGLVRQAPAGEVDETHRVRRDAVARLVELARQDAVGADAVLPVLRHALGDPHHLVRQAAMAALRSLYPTGALAPLAMAIDAAPDLGKAAIDELVPLAEAGDDRAAELVRRALDADAPEVRAHAALRLPRLYPAGSAEPQLVAARSKFGDIRLGAISQLATAPEQTSAIHDALVGSLASEHADLRLAAAIALARRGDPLGIDVLAGFLRGDDHGRAALAALVALADRPASAGAAAEAIAARLDDDPERTADRKALIAALGKLHHEAGAPSLVRLLVAVQAGKEGELADLVEPVLAALGEIVRDRTARMQLLPDGRARARYREDLAIAQLGALAQSPLPAARLGAALRLGNVDDRRAEDVLARLIGDRAPEVRVAAAQALALRAEYVPGATLAALESALRGGRRELVLPAAEGLAARKRPEAFQPLLLVAKAGLPDEQQRALVALGGLGDRRALEHLRPLLDPEVDDEHSRALRSAAIEALGRLAPALEGDEAAEVRARLERFALGGATAVRSRAMIALRFAGMLGLVERVASDREAEGAVRVIAVRELGIARAASSEPVLVELLGDEDGAVRAAAVKALGDVLGGDRTRLSLYALGSKHDDVSAPAARYLAGQGDPATLVARLGQVISADVRRMLREGLIRRAALPVRELDAALRGGDPRPRAEAAWLAGYGGDAAHGLGDAVAAAVAASAAGWTEAAGGRGGAARQADQAHAWRAALWAAGRVGASAAAAGASAVANERAPAEVRRAAIGLVVSGEALGNAVGDADREVRAVASAALAARGASSAAAIVRGLGARADATTIAPLALSAWRELAAPLVAEPSTRAWALAVALAGRTVAELVAIASARGEDPARLAAIAALGRIGGDEAKAVLERIHRDAAEPDAVKLAAWKALRRALRADRTYAEGRDKGKRGEHAPAEADAVDDDEDDDDDDDDDDGGDDGGGDDGGDEDDDDDDDEEDEEDEDEDDDE